MAHTSMATILNLQSNTGSVTLQVLSIIRRSTITIYTPRRHQSLEPGQKIAVENLRTQEWKPVVIQGKIQGIPRSKILCSLHTKRQRVAAQSVADPIVTYRGPDHRDRWVRFHLRSRQAGKGAESKPECHSKQRQPSQPTYHLRTRFPMSLCDARGQIVKATLVQPLRLYFAFCRTLSQFLSSNCL